MFVFDRNKMWMIFNIKHFNDIYDLVRRYELNESTYLPQCHGGCILGYLPSSVPQLTTVQCL